MYEVFFVRYENPCSATKKTAKGKVNHACEK